MHRHTRTWLRVLPAALAAWTLLGAGAASADNYPVIDGQGHAQTFAARLVAGVLHPLHLLEVLVSGTPTALSTGQATKAASIPVVLPSDPDVRSSTSNITAADAASTTVAGQSSVTLVTGTPTANSSIVWNVNGASSATITVTGVFTLSSAIEESADGGQTYGPATAKILGTGATSSTVTAPGVFRIDATGMTNVRLRSTSYTSGTLTAQLVAASSPGLTQILNPVRLADSTGAVTGSAANPLITSQQYAPSGVTAATCTITTATTCAAPTLIPGRDFHVSHKTTGFTGSCQWERKTDGTNWYVDTVTAGGSTTQMYNWSFSASTQNISEIVSESQSGLAQRLNCTAVSAGSDVVTISQ